MDLQNLGVNNEKVLVLGGNGMAGHMITLYLKELNKYEVYNICHKEKLNKESLLCDVRNLVYLNR